MVIKGYKCSIFFISNIIWRLEVILRLVSKSVTPTPIRITTLPLFVRNRYPSALADKGKCYVHCLSFKSIAYFQFYAWTISNIHAVLIMLWVMQQKTPTPARIEVCVVGWLLREHWTNILTTCAECIFSCDYGTWTRDFKLMRLAR